MSRFNSGVSLGSRTWVWALPCQPIFRYVSDNTVVWSDDDERDKQFKRSFKMPAGAHHCQRLWLTTSSKTEEDLGRGRLWSLDFTNWRARLKPSVPPLSTCSLTPVILPTISGTQLDVFTVCDSCKISGSLCGLNRSHFGAYWWMCFCDCCIQRIISSWLPLSSALSTSVGKDSPFHSWHSFSRNG